MLYNEINTANIEGINNYIIKIKPQMGETGDAGLGYTAKDLKFPDELCGIMNDKEISLPFGISLTNPGSIEGVNAIASAMNKTLDTLLDNGARGGSKKSAMLQSVKKLGEGVVGTFEKMTGLDLKDMQPQYTVVRPEKWAKPDISFKCTFYRGLKISKYVTPSFSEFAMQLASATFPVEIGTWIMSFLSSTQLKASDYKSLISVGLGKHGSQTTATETKNFGFQVRVGNLLSADNLWLKNAKISAPTIFDSKGQPVVWEVDFEFEYWRQPTYFDIKKWLSVNSKENYERQ